MTVTSLDGLEVLEFRHSWLISGVFLQGFNQIDLQVLVKLNVLWSEDFRSKVLSVGHLKSRRQP